jgi:thiamine biosynthesis lipoprotein
VTALGTDVKVTVYGNNAQKGAEDASGVFKALGSMLDTSSSSSSLYALDNADGQSVVVPGQIVDMLNAMKTVYDQTGGALDPTIEPVLKLWGFEDGKYIKPADEDLASALKKLCFGDVTVQHFTDSGTYTVTMPAGAELTFNAAARGCAGDYAIQALKDDGVSSAIVSMSGYAQTLGTKPDGTPWNVAVANPDEPASNLGYLSVGETAVSTSGGYTQSFTYSDGETYHHIIDPSTGYPAKTDLKSVTIVCSSGTNADCLSTAMFILGKKAALEYWRNYGGFEMILVTSANQVLCTSGLTESFTLQSSGYTLSYTE